MAVETQNINSWILITLEKRVDAFNFHVISAQLEELMRQGHKFLAVDLSEAQFLGLPAIKLIASVARELVNKKGGLALVAPSEKLKRQFDIFASLDDLTIVRSRKDLGTKPASYAKRSGESLSHQVSPQ